MGRDSRDAQDLPRLDVVDRTETDRAVAKPRDGLGPRSRDEDLGTEAEDDRVSDADVVSAADVHLRVVVDRAVRGHLHRIPVVRDRLVAPAERAQLVATEHAVDVEPGP